MGKAVPDEDTLGPHHPSVTGSMVGLGEIIYCGQGRYPEAEAVFNRALSIREEMLGPEHPAVAALLEQYAVLPRKMDRETEAREMEARGKTIVGEES